VHGEDRRQHRPRQCAAAATSFLRRGGYATHRRSPPLGRSVTQPSSRTRTARARDAGARAAAWLLPAFWWLSAG